MSYIKDFGIMIIIAICLICFYNLAEPYFIENSNKSTDQRTEINLPDQKFGYLLEDNYFLSNTIQENEYLGNILTDNGITPFEISSLESKAKNIFNVRNIRSGKNYHIIKEDSCTMRCKALIYETDPLNYVVYDFADSISVRKEQHPYTTCIEAVSGIIKTSLWDAMIDQNVDPIVIDLMEDALSTSVSFYHTKIGDKFKVLYEQKIVDGIPVTLGKVLGAYYQNKRGNHYGIYYKNEKYAGFYDENGNAAKSSFLLSPIRAGRISSRYNLRRLHPIKKRRIPHRGTDYAAPYGTPIRAVADGVITVRSFSRNNGNYIKIKHNNTYTTQYLHMQNFAKNLGIGSKVKQGQTIGYIGSTGLANGPHVCFRLWKNNEQIDHLRENFPPAEPMSAEEMPNYFEKRDEVISLLDATTFNEETLQFVDIPKL